MKQPFRIEVAGMGRSIGGVFLIGISRLDDIIDDVVVLEGVDDEANSGVGVGGHVWRSVRSNQADVVSPVVESEGVAS